MRKFKVKYEITERKESGIYRFTFFSSERYECSTINEAIKYGKMKAKELNVHFYGVDELKS